MSGFTYLSPTLGRTQIGKFLIGTSSAKAFVVPGNCAELVMHNPDLVNDVNVCPAVDGINGGAQNAAVGQGFRIVAGASLDRVITGPLAGQWNGIATASPVWLTVIFHLVS